MLTVTACSSTAQLTAAGASATFSLAHSGLGFASISVSKEAGSTNPAEIGDLSAIFTPH